MRCGEETHHHAGEHFTIFYDVMCRWFWEINGRPRYIGIDFAVYNDFAKERELAIQLGKLAIENKI